MLKKILIALAVIVVVLVMVVALQPASFALLGATTISAPCAGGICAGKRFPQVGGWNPGRRLDPAMKQGLRGRAGRNRGNLLRGSGNKEVGEGRMTITESRPNELIRIRLEFFKPFAATNTTEFTFKPEADKTAVTWTMIGDNNFMAKAIRLIHEHGQNDRRRFREGLAQMKSVAETTGK